MESRILDKFDGSPYVVDGEEYHYTWKVAASKFATKTGEQAFPVINVITTGPTALTRMAGDTGAKSLGIQGAFDRTGFNWIDIYPTRTDDADGTPAEIPLLGRTRFLDVWVWGSNLNYRLEAYIRDNRGVMHVIPMGSLRYTGWKNLRSAVPTGIPMVSNVIPRSTHSTSFVKFRLWTDPKERTYVDIERDKVGKITRIVPFYVYLSQLKVLSDIYETIYDGDELANPKVTTRLWSGAGGDGGAAAQGQ
ncbi:MAG: flagellar filament outer layer protein FlaA [Spirochaetaceae bacterium]|nr:flagellar filament outer layer protein FlaA [Spirochaetaceae bacterium]